MSVLRADASADASTGKEAQGRKHREGSTGKEAQGSTRGEHNVMGSELERTPRA